MRIPVASAATSASRTAISPRPKSAVRDIGCHPCDETGSGKTEKIETRMGVEWRGHLRAGQANTAAGHTLPRQRDLRDNRRKTKRTDREVKRAQPKRRQSDDHAEDRAGDARDRERRKDGHRR